MPAEAMSDIRGPPGCSCRRTRNPSPRGLESLSFRSGSSQLHKSLVSVDANPVASRDDLARIGVEIGHGGDAGDDGAERRFGGDAADDHADRSGAAQPRRLEEPGPAP